MSSLRVVVAEDSVLFRDGLVRLLTDRGYTVVAEVGDAPALLSAIEAEHPDIAVVDIRMPPGNTFDGAVAAQQIRENHPDVAVLLLSQHLELRHCRTLAGTPGFGYLLKDRVLRVDDFTAALDRIAAGGVALDPEVVRGLVARPAASQSLAALTEREKEVLALVAAGHTNAEIGRRLHVSDRTVETHMGSVFGKLDLVDDGVVHRRVRAVIAWLEAQA